MTSPRSFASHVVAAAIACLVSIVLDARAIAALQQSQVLLLYNSQNATSLAIRNAYVAKYPGVLQFDINLPYPSLAPTDPQSSTPPEPWRINNQFVTRKMFDEIFFNFGNESLTNYQSFLAENTQIRAIATTRGLPAAVDDNFNPSAGGPFASKSFESLLASKRSAASTGSRPNAYYGWDVDYEAFLHACGQLGPNGLPPNDMYLVCRLDSGAHGSASEADYRDAAIAMIQRSGVFGVNQYGVTTLTDAWTANTCINSFSDFDSIADRVWRAGWCVMRDTTEVVIHGLTDPLRNSLDEPFTLFPTISLTTFGRNHSIPLEILPGLFCTPPAGGEAVFPEYVSYYTPHPAGLFYAVESFSGWGLHSPSDTHPYGQGFAPDWIAAGGGFAICHVTEPGTTDRFFPSFGIPAFLALELSFAESAYIGIPKLGHVVTPVGDPLARVVRYDPDLDDNRTIDAMDLAIVEAQIGTNGPLGDINRDGVVNTADRQHVIDVLGRNGAPPPPVPFSPWVYPWNWTAAPPGGVATNAYYIYLSTMRCRGDTTGEGCVNSVDLALVLSLVGTRCPEGDMNRDGICTSVDVNIVQANQGRFWPDVSQNGIIDQADRDIILAATGPSPPANPDYDFNCDGIVGGSEVNIINSYLGAQCTP